MNDADRTAGSLYLQYAPILRRIGCRKYDIPLEDVDALVHDVFATYLVNPSTVRDPRAYLIGGICNAAREYWRERRREIPLEDHQEPVLPERVFENLSERLTVAATVARLRRRCRDLLRRRQKALEIYYRAEELARDPQHADLIPHVERMRAAYERDHGRPIPARRN